MIGQLSNVFENSRKTGFSDLFSDGKPAETSREFESTARPCVVLRKARLGAGQQSEINDN